MKNSMDLNKIGLVLMAFIFIIASVYVIAKIKSMHDRESDAAKTRIESKQPSECVGCPGYEDKELWE